MAAGAPLIRLQGVVKQYGQQQVLRGIDLEVHAGQVLTLIGRSGSGKSSLLRTLNGLAPLDGGSVQVGDVQLLQGLPPPDRIRALRKRVGMVFQKFNLFPHLTAVQNVALALHTVQGRGRKEAHGLACVQLEKVGLGDRLNAWPHQLSGGQQQRVAIARALALAPDVLLCDEITSALDPELTAEVLAVIRALAAEGMTILMATHEMDFAREVSDRLVFLLDGRIHEEGPADRLFSAPRTPELARFIGAMG